MQPDKVHVPISVELKTVPLSSSTVPVQELRLKYKIGADGEWTDAADGDTLRFTSGLDVSYACEVKVDGDDTAPIMAVTLNNGDITGE